MAMKSEALDSWRDYFRTSNSDIFDIIERAIMVAACDCPTEFRVRRDRIAEILFSSKITKCLGCDRVELSVPGDDEMNGEFERNGCQFGVDGGSKESKMNSSRDDQGEEMNMNQVSNYSYGEAEALTDEIEEEDQIVGEVLRIKEILDNSPDESNSVLFESLTRLQLLALSVDTLRVTEIGKSVNVLRKHRSKDISQLARTLIGVWKVMVDEWVNATAALAEGTPESVNPSVVDEEEEEGLPSPPLDDLALLAPPTGIELSQFFDGMDDDGNPRNSGELNKNRDSNCRKVSKEEPRACPKPQIAHEPYVPQMVKTGNENKKHEVLVKKRVGVVKPNKHSNAESIPGRPTKMNLDQKVGKGTKCQQKSGNPMTQKKPPAAQPECMDHAARLEASKRKLQERYQEAENAKRQRTIQVMELHDLPKQGLAHKPPHVRPGNRNRNWANGRR